MMHLETLTGIEDLTLAVTLNDLQNLRMELSFSDTLIRGVRRETVIGPLSFFLNIYFICFNTVRLSDSKVVFVLLFCILCTIPHDTTRLLSQVLTLISQTLSCLMIQV